MGDFRRKVYGAPRQARVQLAQQDSRTAGPSTHCTIPQSLCGNRLDPGSAVVDPEPAVTLRNPRPSLREFARARRFAGFRGVRSRER